MFRRRRRKINDDQLPQEENRTVKLTREREKEPKRQKPWGKKERFLVSFVLITTIVVPVCLAFIARNGKVPGLPRIAGNLGFSETVVIENKTPTPIQKEKSQTIIDNFNEAVRPLSGIYALSVVDLNTGVSFGVNQNEVMEAASLIKMPVIVAAYSESEAGRFALDSKYSLKNGDKVGGSGSIAYKDPGTIFSYRELVSYMGQQSDNTAFNVVRKKLTDAIVNKYIDEIGLKNTNLDENTTTPAEMARIFEKIYEGSLVTKKDSDEIWKILTKTIYEDYLPKGIPEGIGVAHKYGREVHVINDGGVVFAKNPYAVVIMTSGVVEPEAEKIFPTLSKIVYEGMEN